MGVDVLAFGKLRAINPVLIEYGALVDGEHNWKPIANWVKFLRADIEFTEQNYAKALHGKDQRDMRAIAERGIDFETAYPTSFKWGTWLRRVTFERAFAPDELARIPERHRLAPNVLVTRSEVREVPMPEFQKVSNRVEVIFDAAVPTT